MDAEKPTDGDSGGLKRAARYLVRTSSTPPRCSTWNSKVQELVNNPEVLLEPHSQVKIQDEHSPQKMRTREKYSRERRNDDGDVTSGGGPDGRGLSRGQMAKMAKVHR